MSVIVVLLVSSSSSSSFLRSPSSSSSVPPSFALAFRGGRRPVPLIGGDDEGDGLVQGQLRIGEQRVDVEAVTRDVATCNLVPLVCMLSGGCAVDP